jgi:hypothetical protein
MSLNLAFDLWEENLKEPQKSDHTPEAEWAREQILKMIQQDGLGWQGWIKSYTGDGAFAWCGAFAAYTMPWVRKELRYKWFASTYRLSEYGKKDARRLVKTDNILPGDIVCVGQGNYGSHITRAVCWDKNKAELVSISGNGVGRLGDGSWGEGVVMNVYSRHEIRACYRPLVEDM